MAATAPCEGDALQPVGEYAMSCLGRERVFEHFSKHFGTQVALLRLNYACELRYGVLVDLARRIWHGKSVPLEVAYFNTIWQRDANAMSLRAFDHVRSPACVINVSGPEKLSVRSVSEHFAALLGKPVHFSGQEGKVAILADPRRGQGLLGPSQTPAAKLMEWVADWVARGGRDLAKPTHFEASDGKF